MHAFYFEGSGGVGERVCLPKDEARHAERVLRLSPGDSICVMDGVGRRFRAVIETMENGVFVRLQEEMDSHEAPVQIVLYQGVPKADKLDFIIQKITELGAAALAPVKMERCVVRLEEKDGEKRHERLSRIAREAAKQCGRAMATAVIPAMSWKHALEDMRACDLLIVPWEEAQERRMKNVFAGHPDARRIGIVIGPEGGMSDKEVDAMRSQGADVITLGPRILRTETAAVVSVAMAMSLWGDL